MLADVCGSMFVFGWQCCTISLLAKVQSTCSFLVNSTESARPRTIQALAI